MENEQTKSEIEKLLEQAKTKFAELEDEYNKFAGIREELKSKTSTIKGLHTKATSESSQISNILKDVQRYSEEAGTALQNISKIKAELDTYSQRFAEIKSQFDDPNKGLATNLRISQETRDKIDQKYQEIIKTQGQIEELKQGSATYKAEAEAIQKQIKEYEKSIADTLKLVTATSLTGSFVERRRLLQKRSTKWSWLNLVTTLLLGIAVLFIYYINTSSDNTDWHSWYRYLFTSPLIYLVYYCSKNHTLERDLEEKYAFKAVLSTSLESYIKLLHDKYPHKIDNLFVFTLQTIGTIYEKPYSEAKKRTKIYFGFKNVINGGLELDRSTKDRREGVDSKVN